MSFDVCRFLTAKRSLVPQLSTGDEQLSKKFLKEQEAHEKTLDKFWSRLNLEEKKSVLYNFLKSQDDTFMPKLIRNDRHEMNQEMRRIVSNYSNIETQEVQIIKKLIEHGRVMNLNSNALFNSSLNAHIFSFLTIKEKHNLLLTCYWFYYC